MYDTTTAGLKRLIAPLVTMAVSFLLLMGCATPLAAGRGVDQVDLTVREPLPAVGTIDPQPLRIAVAAVLSPEATLESYTELAVYLGERLDRSAELVQRRTYAEVNELIARGEVDLAFVCTSAYVHGDRGGYMDLLAVPEIGGSTFYHSSIIVPSTSSATSFADLDGARFAFTDPMSLTGRVYATSLVHALGSTPDEFFSEVVFTYSHDKAIEAVAAGFVDGAGVHDLVLQYLLRRDQALVSKIRVIGESPDFGIPPVVVPSATPAPVRTMYQELLIDLVASEPGRSILANLGIDRFVLGSADAYDDVRRLMRDHALDQ